MIYNVEIIVANRFGRNDLLQLTVRGNGWEDCIVVSDEEDRCIMSAFNATHADDLIGKWCVMDIVKSIAPMIALKPHRQQSIRTQECALCGRGKCDTLNVIHHGKGNEFARSVCAECTPGFIKNLQVANVEFRVCLDEQTRAIIITGFMVSGSVDRWEYSSGYGVSAGVAE